MDLVTYNIDHPTHGSKRFNAIRNHLLARSPDLLILTEANAALRLPGYTAIFSEESPYLRRGRNMAPPNRYHQVAIYAKGELRELPNTRNTNGVGIKITLPTDTRRVPPPLGAGGPNPPPSPKDSRILRVYGSVFTIKDRWAKWSDKTYRDRVQEQCAIIRQLAGPDFLVAGDFNFRGPRSYNKLGAERVTELVETTGLHWPTKHEDRTVQNLLHASDLVLTYDVDTSIRLSDHPVVSASLRRKES